MMKTMAMLGFAVSLFSGCGPVSSSSSTPPPGSVPPEQSRLHCGTFRGSSGTEYADSLPRVVTSNTVLPPDEQHERGYDGTLSIFTYTLVLHASANDTCLTPEILEVGYQLRSDGGNRPLDDLSWSSIIGSYNYGRKEPDGSNILIAVKPGTIMITPGQDQGFPLWIKPVPARVPRGTVIWTKPSPHVKWRTVESGAEYEGDLDAYFTPPEKVIVFE